VENETKNVRSSCGARPRAKALLLYENICPPA
jgi:hypothetical protein